MTTGTASLFPALAPSDPRNSFEVETPALLPCGCDGSGRIRYIEREPEGTAKPLGDGLVAGPAVTHGTYLCKCRYELAEREGEASWWTSKTVYSADWQGAVFEPSAEVSVRGEVPISEDNYVLRRTGKNFYWPCSVSVELSDPSMGWLFPEEARELARLLIEAADAAEAYDTVPDE